MEGEWIAGFSALGGALIGAISSYFASIKVQEHNTKQRAKALRSALVTEIIALSDIAKDRKYEQGFVQQISILRQSPATPRCIQIQVPEHYSRIYQENAKDLGILDAEDAARIVKFHQYIDAVIQDVIPGGNIYNGAELQSFTQTLSIYKEALKIADEFKAENSLK